MVAAGFAPRARPALAWRPAKLGLMGGLDEFKLPCMNSRQPAHLLIDGYNVIHACADLLTLFRKNAEAARNTLVEKVRVIHDVDGLAVDVVFDGDGSSITATTPGEQPTFRIIFSSRGLTADGIIEQLVLKSSCPTSCTIITGDNMIRSSVRAAGAVVFGSDYLMAWVERCSQQQGQRLHHHRKRELKQWKTSSPWDQLG